MRKVIVNFSGGKDSTVAVLEALKVYPKDEIILVYMDTGAEYAGTADHVEKIAKILGLPLVKLEPKRDWYEEVRHNGYPFHIQFRKCTFRLKVDTWNRWFTQFKKENPADEYIQIYGMRAEESGKRALMPEWNLNERGVWEWLPVQKMRKQEIFDRIKAEGLPIHYCYEFSDRCNCWLCIYATKYQMQEYARVNYTDFEKACLLEDEIKKPILNGQQKINDLFKQGKLI